MIFDRDHPDYDKDEIKGRQILIKWSSVPYSESVAYYEFERDLVNAKVQYETPMDLYFRRNRKPTEKWFQKEVRCFRSYVT